MTTSSSSIPQTLAGKVAIVTGGTRGIGASIALSLASRGAHVCITYTSTSSVSLADSIVSQIESFGNGAKATSIQADIRKPDSSAKIVAHALKALEAEYIDILVNNAGVTLIKPVGQLAKDDFDYIFHTNILGPVLMLEAVLPHFVPRNGRIVNVSSVVARMSTPTVSLYASSKAAIEGLTRCWAAELGSKGHTVNAVAPGPVQSDMLDLVPAEFLDLQKKLTPLENRLGKVEDISPIVAWLCGPESAWVTAQTISASGGHLVY